jgi:hypothetical protein
MTSRRRNPVGSVRLAPEAYAPGASPLLDIGGEVGALVVYLAEPTASGELEACPAGRPDERFHTGVHPRMVGARSVPVAVFPELPRGTYEVLGPDRSPVALVDVTGGEVSEIRIPAAGSGVRTP